MMAPSSLDLATTERAKYQRMWLEPTYRQWSPGEAAASQFLSRIPWQAGETLVDLGCGTGRAGVALAAQGLIVTLLDCCHEAIELGSAGLPFIEANLWTLPPLTFDWLYCVDVLEHLPTETIDDALDGFAQIATKGGFLQIALFEDGCGKMIGETLHLTIQPHAWWHDKVSVRWPILYDLEGRDSRGIDGYSTFCLGAPYGL